MFYNNLSNFFDFAFQVPYPAMRAHLIHREFFLYFSLQAHVPNFSAQQAICFKKYLSIFDW